ncbi:MAG: hypothetical protein COA38_14510 [Fluviicola sp.]|nr:MAG: hypothetical protein COA38_14510 [Fluviicola sp.]
MKAMKRTILVGTSMFALISGVSAQTDTSRELEAFKINWKKSHKVVEMTSAQYGQLKIDWVKSQFVEPKRVSDELSVEPKRELKKAERNRSQNLPADFPFKKNTGNAQADADAYQLEKARWIEDNKDLYKQMTTTPKATTSEQEAIRQQERNNQIK